MQVRLAHHPSTQVLIALALAIALGVASPQTAAQMKPLADSFIKLVRMLLPFVIFTTIVPGLSHARDRRHLGRVGLKTLLYFEVVSTIALLLGFVVISLVQPGVGLHATKLVVNSAVAQLSGAAPHSSVTALLLDIIPANLLDGFAKGDILQVLFVSVLIGLALSAVQANAINVLVEQAQQVVFKILSFIMRLAPLGAFGAMAAAIGAHGSAALTHLAGLVIVFYVSAALFVFVVLGSVTTLMSLSLLSVLRLIKEELLLVFSVASSEVVLPRLLAKLEWAGVAPDIAGFVLPAGYSLNLDGTALFMATGLGFIAQATDTPLSLYQQLSFVAVMMLTSKGHTGLGGSLVKIAATIQSTPIVPLAGLGLLVSVERPIASAIGVTNVIGHVVGTLFVAKWERCLDVDRFRTVAGLLRHQSARQDLEQLVARRQQVAQSGSA